RETPQWQKTQKRQYSAPKPEIQQKQPAASFGKGDKVIHTTFGNGIITNVTQAGKDALLEITFDNEGPKRLMQNNASRYLTKV
ncbi:MAG: hypothetical protein LBD23_05160, partial [Oscillospiraceae bacterium]|nr:hypothetical protein [Oscillospiraceae bacterium]